LIKKYTQGSFQKDYIKTLGAQFSKYDEEIEGDNCKLFFWDIAGQREFDFMRPTFYKGSKAAIIVFSHTDEESFSHISSWHEDIKKYTGDLPIVLFGNKIDLVDEEDLNDQIVNELLEEKGFLGYYKTSAKTGNGVYKAFQAIIKELYNKYKEE
jgi:small GTP-binding protein